MTKRSRIGYVTRYEDGVRVGRNPSRPSSIDLIEREWRSSMNPNGINEAVSIERTGFILTVTTTEGSVLRYVWSAN